jgi:hypothetical protein
MILAVCIDDQGGMAFNRRRQSRDRAQQEDLLKLCGGVLRIAPYSALLFDWAPEQVLVSEDFLTQTKTGEYCFVEDRSPASVADRVEAVVLYRWNRSYPSDLKFDLDLSAFRLVETIEFSGTSHETITREIYQRRECAHG